MKTLNLTKSSYDLFSGLIHDAGNWNDQPMVDLTPALRGNLTQLKKAGLLTTSTSDGIQWVHFTQAGADYAKAEFLIDVDVTAK